MWVVENLDRRRRNLGLPLGLMQSIGVVLIMARTSGNTKLEQALIFSFQMNCSGCLQMRWSCSTD